MNPHIKEYASAGGKARATRLDSATRSEIARKASHTRACMNKQDKKELAYTTPPPDTEYKEKYMILREFLQSKDVDVDDLIEQSQVARGEFDEVVPDVEY